jgi:hypothetical protein
MEFEFGGEVVQWRGPAPYYFVRIPAEISAAIKVAAKGLEYWGQVAVLVAIGDTDFATALFPKDGVYLLPLRVAIRRAEGIEEGEHVHVALDLARRD